VLAQSLRLIAPSVLFFGLSGGVTGLLYALKRFNYTAASAAAFNLGIVVLAPLLAPRLNVYVLPIGIVAGALAQLLVMLPALRDVRLGFSLAWDHPGVQLIMRLYMPIAVGLIINEIQVVIDGRWASATGAQSVAWMRYATTLIQLPLGLVPVAVSLAALPSLSQRAAAGDWENFGRIFGRGLRLVLVLLIPATAGLTSVVRSVAQSGGPLLAAALVALPMGLSAPLIACAGLKITYDVALYLGFRDRPAPEERRSTA
jgi:putative peptidoglycan lipid II flippase